eukprot:TRINITY_DN41970_c0_g1_i1.p1 TRINITY_DN41970_c0_g1~~TRINITY_DN41970_c0_g1_i1.p1  ORF type:complete len:1146 (-),score=258.09 TRINITY_DN41970_c0_g1_i1:213-3650(-)
MCEDMVQSEDGAAHCAVRCSALADDTWVLGVTFGAEHPARKQRPCTRFHFVLDNSGSMGRNSQNAKDCFADLVSVANGPCSLVAFESNAVLLGENFQTADAMRKMQLPRQGGTNITAGIEAAVAVIRRCAMQEAAKESGSQATHHVLVLLSDGAHTVGERPELRLPKLGAELLAELSGLRLSVVVVGVTRNSNTSLGMLLKQSLETVSLPALEPIYFADTPQLMGETLKEMHIGLASLGGCLVNVSASNGSLLVRAVGDHGTSSIDLLADSQEQAVLCLGKLPPADLLIDGVACPCAEMAFDAELAASALQRLVSDARVKRIALGAERVRPALQQLGTWVNFLESREAEQRAIACKTKLQLGKATPAMRLAQHKSLKSALQGARELRNQLAEIDACAANDSASQAAFLTGSSSKYGAKALRRAAAHGPLGEAVDPKQRLQELLHDVARLAPAMRQALREDFCTKLAMLSEGARNQLRSMLESNAPPIVSRHLIATLCSGDVTADKLDADKDLAGLVDSGLAIESLCRVTGNKRQSYLSLQTVWEQLKEWCDFAMAGDCKTEYQLLMCLGTIGYPIDVQRRAATQMNPYAMDITRVRPSLVDTASLSTALYSEQEVVPPEGGLAVQDVLVLVDPDAPRASRLAASSLLLREAYTSVALCRDLHMYTGNAMRLALHAHSLFAAVQAPPSEASKEDLAAQLRRQYLGRAFQCRQCGFGPIDHFACGDLEAHHGEHVGGAVINNACPHCGWFSDCISDWPQWDGSLPPAATNDAETHKQASDANRITAASLDVALRICYSARAIWKSGPESEAHMLCDKLASWETITSADGVDHPVQLLLALAVSDDIPEGVLGQVPVLALLNEVCARKARDELRRTVGTEEPAIMAAARKRVAAFLGVTKETAPQTQSLEESEPQRAAVREICLADFTLDTTSFDFKSWVKDALDPWVPAVQFVKRLRAVLSSREGGWRTLKRDMESGPEAYADVVHELQKPASSKDTLRSWLGVTRACEAERVLATVAAQAFMHQSSQLRRTVAAGGSLAEPLGDVRDGATLRAISVDIRMAIYDERVAAKMQEWGRLGASLTFQRARAADLEQYSSLCAAAPHVHGLDKQTFWGLWRAATEEKAKAFLQTANQGFVSKYGQQTNLI